MQRTKILAAGVAVGAVLAATPALAHFQELIPSQPLVTQAGGPDLTLGLTFTHPMENGPAMEMARPQAVTLHLHGGAVDLTPALKPVKRQGAAAFDLPYHVAEPGDHVFTVTPAPYWEPAEGVMIVHHTKVVVNAYGEEGGWEEPVGLPVEIQPLTRPYGLWTGNVFQGRVLKDGKPVPDAEVEVEYRSEGAVTPPADPFVTQVVRADANGVFTYAMPREGWWGFAALVEGDTPMKNPAGETVPVELGGLIWVHTRDMR